MARALPLLLVLAACGTLEGTEPGDGGASGTATDAADAASATDAAGHADGADPDGGPGAEGGVGLPLGSSCLVGGPPCAAGAYCDSRSCAVGTCVAKGAAPVNFQYAPVCGCDGITYWSIYDSMYAGVSYAQSGECAKTALTTRVCQSGTSACPPGTYCGILTISTMCAETEGKCWKLPDTCPSGTGIGTPMETCANKCVSYCDAIKAQAPYYYDTQKCAAP